MGKYRITLNLEAKLVLLLLFIALVPTLLLCLFWKSDTSSHVQENAEHYLTQVSDLASEKVSHFIDTKLTIFNAYSQNIAINKAKTQESLINLLAQDPDILMLSVASATGSESAKMDRGRIYSQSEFGDVKVTDEFSKIISGERYYIGPVVLNDTRIPYVTIATPIVAQHMFMTNDTPLQPTEVKGVLIGRISLSNIIRSISEIKIGKSGYVIIVDNQGVVIAHPRAELIGTTGSSYPDSEIQQFLQSAHNTIAPIPVHISTNLRGIKVLSTHMTLSKSGWGVIAEQPVDELSGVVADSQRRFIIFLIFTCVAIIIGKLYINHSITHPIKEVTRALDAAEKGTVQYPIDVHTHDELQELATRYSIVLSSWRTDQQKLIREKNNVTTILESSEDGVLAIDIHHKIIYCNRSALKLLRYMPDELHETAFDDVIRIYANETRIFFSDLISYEANKIPPIKLINHIGEQKNITASVALIKDETTDIRYVVTMYDSSRQQEVEGIKLDFVSMAAHELRTPLTAIRGYAQLLEHNLEQSQDPDTKEYVKRLSISCENLSNLVDNLLNVTRIERNTLKIEKIPLDAVELIHTVVRDLKQQAETKSQTLQFIEPTSPLPRVMADKYRILQVLTNLTANAINYTPQSGSITLQIAQKDQSLEISVTDTGIGIPQESLPKLFTKFYRVSGALEEGSKGTGLGLFITKSIVTMHGGTIGVDSVRGKGSTFKFTLPIATKEELEQHEQFLRSALPGLQHKGMVFNKDRIAQHFGS